MRTQEQIIQDCEKRYAELVAEKKRRDNDPIIQYPCKTCRWYSHDGEDGFCWGDKFPEHHTCVAPLVKGFSKHGLRISRYPHPCGREKALWEPKISILERILFGWWR